MLIIGHRGAAGDAPENTLEAMRFGQKAGAHMLEFDVQLTRDGVPIVIHDATLRRTHNKRTIVRFSSHKKIVEDSAHGHSIALLEDVLDEFYGKVILNLELKSRGSAKATVEMLTSKYITKEGDWDLVLLSSFHVSELVVVRAMTKRAQISLLHYRNPLKFVFAHRLLNLSAAGFHYVFMTKSIIRLAKYAGLFTYAYTVNQPMVADDLAEAGLDAVVTDHPKKMYEHLQHAKYSV